MNREKIVKFALLLLGFIPLIYWVFKFINKDLWFDEVQSFRGAVFCDFIQTLTYYPTPNNHIFFNLTSQIITRIFSIRNITELINNIHILRSFQVFITLFSLTYSIKLINKIFKFEYSYLLCTILFTTLPYMNFAIQLRGYNLSSLILLSYIYHAWAYLIEKRKYDTFMIIFSSTLLCYTLPSNLYILASALTGFFILYLYYKKGNIHNYPQLLTVIYLTILGMFFCLILYLPVLKNMFIDQSTRTPPSLFYAFTFLPSILMHFLSERYLLLIPIFIGSKKVIKNFKVRSATENTFIILLLLTLILPFVFAFLHQRRVFDRLFISLAPIFVIFITTLILISIQSISSSKLKWSIIFAIPIYCISVFFVDFKQYDDDIKNIFLKGEKLQDISRNFYLSSYYNPKDSIELLMNIQKDTNIILYHHVDHASSWLYFKYHKLQYTKIISEKELKNEISESKNSLILTSFKDKTIKDLEQINSLKITIVSEKSPIFTILKVESNLANTKKADY